MIDPRVEEVWAEAREIPPAARAAWLDGRCGGDAALRAEVESLLEHTESGESFFGELAAEVGDWAEAAASGPLQAGARVGPYEAVREVGRGGMGVVWEGRDTRLDRRVALKVLPPWLAGDPGSRERLVAEARAASAIEHPNLATLYDVVELADGSLCLVLALYEGETLRERLARGPMPVAEAVDAVAQAARGLAEVHRRGIVHRDVKPANLFRTAEGRIVVLDFGVAKALGEDRTARGVRPGTVAYMAPEQARGEPVDPRTDVWALGVVLHEAVTGRHPFRRGTEAATLEAIERARPPRLDRARPGVPGAVARVAARALEKAPAARFADGGALAAALAPRTGGRIRWARPALAAALAGLLAGGAWLQHGPALPAGDAAMEAAVMRVAVLPFEVQGDPTLDYLGEGLASLLSVSLDGAGGIHSVDPFAVFERSARAGPIAPASAERIADGLGAGRYVLGQVVAAGDQLRIQAFLYEPARGPEPLARVSVEGPVDRIFNLVDEIASQLIVADRAGPGEALTQVAAVTTGSIDAFKAFLEGEQRFREGRWIEAVEALERAVAADSTFALAWYRLSEASGWLPDFEREIAAAHQADRLSERLPPIERQIVRAHLLWPRGEVDEAERLYLEVIDARPQSADAWYGLGELYFHQNPLRGRSWTEARGAFERSIELSGRERYEALIHLADLAAAEGRLADHDAIHARLPAGGDFAVVYAAQKAFVSGGRAERERALARLAEAGPGPTIHAVRRTAAFARDAEGALRMARLLPGEGEDARVRAAGHLSVALLEAAVGGGWPAARAELDLAEPLAGPTVRLWRGLFATHPALDVPRADVEAARAALEAWDPARPEPVPPALSMDKDLLGPLRIYTLGVIAARLGDRAAVRRHAAALAGISSPASRELPRDLGHDLTARALGMEGRWEEALAELERIQWTRDYDRAVRSPYFQLGHTRWLRAEALERLGRREEALRWYRSLAQGYFETIVFDAAVARREEAILAADGDR